GAGELRQLAVRVHPVLEADFLDAHEARALGDARARAAHRGEQTHAVGPTTESAPGNSSICAGSAPTGSPSSSSGTAPGAAAASIRRPRCARTTGSARWVPR